MRDLRLAAGVDHVDLRGDLVAGAEPGLGDQREDVVGVVARRTSPGRGRRTCPARPRSGRWRRAWRSGRRRRVPAAFCSAIISAKTAVARSTTPASNAPWNTTMPGPSIERTGQLGLHVAAALDGGGVLAQTGAVDEHALLDRVGVGVVGQVRRGEAALDEGAEVVQGAVGGGVPAGRGRGGLRSGGAERGGGHRGPSLVVERDGRSVRGGAGAAVRVLTTLGGRRGPRQR